MMDLDERILESIRCGKDTLSQTLALIYPSLRFRTLDRALQRLRRAGRISFNRKRGCWELTPAPVEKKDG